MLPHTVCARVALLVLPRLGLLSDCNLAGPAFAAMKVRNSRSKSKKQSFRPVAASDASADLPSGQVSTSNQG